MQDEATEKKLICEIDMHELACIIAEASIGIKRPVGMSPNKAMLGFDDETRKGLYDVAWAAATYVTDCLNKAKMVN